MAEARKKLSYRRVLIKLSGEALTGQKKCGFELEAVQKIALEIKAVRDLKIGVGVVVGGGNIFRGGMAEEFGFSRTPADHIGMLATMINGMVLQQCLAALGCSAHVMSAFNTDSIIEMYVWHQAMRYLSEGSIVIFVGGTGNPYFTTDTAAALRASEIEADVLIKATKVDGVYDKDPIRHKDAKKYARLTYAQALAEKLNVMDATAIALCRENNIPIHVVNLFKKGSLLKAVREKSGGSIVTGE